ncbi:hypothetical protein ABB37_01749 [Leptomonas pyrrhocoris]|uniref:Trypanosoma Tc-38 (p38) protein domain-containing protein n=1 Tax=Leptomonas pyrrhocoris TaxID=157538 RepID=A0A0M9G986_LEPPY|nr:hypothetical protein ABB37_01749 [Leptomonas pyrrhocoris]KPA85450.1 hypothetical protein ABB37_01749 [Leptomonas pyrrhocoris]|eukprot:XP_015663889.1 hypothetical protein ABB37_01749 [Leptomonas pyrrhocoris]
MSAIGSRQQRLFTGALFPEVLNAQLFAFAARHHLKSNVWVPRKAFDAALKPYNVFVLPNAALCDVSLTPGGGAVETTEAIGTDLVLVNAQHTSNQKFMEEFRDFLVSRLTTPVLPRDAITSLFLPQTFAAEAAGRLDAKPYKYIGVTFTQLDDRAKGCAREKDFFSAADQLSAKAETDAANACADFTQQDQQPQPRQPVPILQPEPLWDRLPPFQYPLALNGSLLMGAEVARRLLALQKQGRFYSNYWRRLRSPTAKLQSFFYTGQTEYAGRYNPFYCVRYVPHNYTGRPFPLDIARLMRHRAVEYGYVSRMWLTRRQGEELFGTTLLPEHAHDFPVVCCNFHSGGLESIAYYCADQFAHSEDLFPTQREIELAAKGVWIPSTKIAAFPLLRQLQEKYTTETTPVSSDRSGMDLAKQDANRHTEFCQRTEAYSAIRLVGFDQDKGDKHIRAAHLGKALHRQCVLCGYPTPVFISHRTLINFNLAVKDGEEGVVQLQCPVKLPYDNAWTNGECWFNIAQMREPAVGAELMEHWPRHFLTRRRLNRNLAAQCCRLQIAERARTAMATPAERNTTDPAAAAALDSEWVPLYMIEAAGWKLRPGAAGVRYVPNHDGEDFTRYYVGKNIMFRVADVCLDASIVAWMRRYTPINAQCHPYLRGLRQLLTLRAYERGYQSQTWVAFPDVQATAASLPVRLTPSPVRAGITPLATSRFQFSQPPFVRLRDLVFVNKEELAPPLWQAARGHNGVSDAAMGGGAAAAASDEPDAPLRRMNAATRAMVEDGVGISAEAFLTGAAQSRMQRPSSTPTLPTGTRLPISDTDDDDGGADAVEDVLDDDDDVGELPYEGSEA